MHFAPMLPLYGLCLGPALFLYPFRNRDERAGKRVRARYVAAHHELVHRHAQWEIIGAPEVRLLTPNARSFTPRS